MNRGSVISSLRAAANSWKGWLSHFRIKLVHFPRKKRRSGDVWKEMSSMFSVLRCVSVASQTFLWVGPILCELHTKSIFAFAHVFSGLTFRKFQILYFCVFDTMLLENCTTAFSVVSHVLLFISKRCKGIASSCYWPGYHFNTCTCTYASKDFGWKAVFHYFIKHVLYSLLLMAHESCLCCKQIFTTADWLDSDIQ